MSTSVAMSRDLEQRLVDNQCLGWVGVVRVVAVTVTHMPDLGVHQLVFWMRRYGRRYRSAQCVGPSVLHATSPSSLLQSWLGGVREARDRAVADVELGKAAAA